jgi:HlyD family secretion protein
MKKRKRLIRTLGPVLAAVSLLGLAFLNKGRAAGPAYRYEVLARGDIEALVSTSGTLAAEYTVDVGSQVSGKIVRLFADYNSEVKAGQVVAELDQEILRSQVETREANYQSALASLEQSKSERVLAQKKYERARSLNQDKLVSSEDTETAESAAAAAQSAVRVAEGNAAQALSSLESSRVNLSYAVVRTPISGTVITRSVSVGQTVAASYEAPVLFKIASDLASMRVECSVDEAEIARIKEGQSARFTVGAYPAETFSGVVRQVRNSSTTNSNVVTYTAVIDAQNPGRLLKPGMTASVSIVAAKVVGVLRVQAAALSFKPAALTVGQERRFAELRKSIKPGVSVIWRLDAAGGLEPVLVKTGVTDKTYCQILSGEVEAGQKIVTGLQTGSAAAVSTQDFPPPPPDGMMPPPPPNK